MYLKFFIPNIFTAANIILGVFSILNLIFGAEIELSLYFLLIASVFDFFDGFFARILHAQTKFGKEFDSLADLISFGVMPAAALFYFSLQSYYFNNLFALLFCSLPAMIYLLSAAIRLAWYNSDLSQAINFKGLASPASAIAVVSIVIYHHELVLNVDYGFFFLSAIASALMLMPIKVMSLKFTKSKIHLFFFIIIVGISSFLLIFTGLKALWIIVLIYYCMGIIMLLLSNLKANS